MNVAPFQLDDEHRARLVEIDTKWIMQPRLGRRRSVSLLAASGNKDDSVGSG
jgi:hypothetical protein